jgi:hypothetical protein
LQGIWADTADSLPKQFVKKNKGMFLFDFQTVNFQASKKDPSIAEIGIFQEWRIYQNGPGGNHLSPRRSKQAPEIPL